MSRVVTIEGSIVQAKPEDLHEPWIRVSKTKRKGIINNKDFVKVRANNKTVYCQMRGTSKEDSEEIEMSEHYRELLGWEHVPIGNTKLEVTRINQTFGIWRIIYYHPDDFVRIGIGLGLASVLIASVSLLKFFLQPISPINPLLAIFISLIIAFAIGLLSSIAVSFLMPLKR